MSTHANWFDDPPYALPVGLRWVPPQRPARVLHEEMAYYHAKLRGTLAVAEGRVQSIRTTGHVNEHLDELWFYLGEFTAHFERLPVATLLATYGVADVSLYDVPRVPPCALLNERWGRVRIVQREAGKECLR